MGLIPPFKVGAAVELRSFEAGYRGAWFRCKITDIRFRHDQKEYEVEHMDYPDEERSWTRLHQTPPKYCNQKAGQNRELMLRPPYPRWSWEDDYNPEHGQKTGVVAVASKPLKVGDLIDWWYNCCFWTGEIIEVLGVDKVKIACLEIPLGEGGIYEADVDDLRPALDWSLEKGWSAPLPKEIGECWYTAPSVTENPDKGSSSPDEDIEQSHDGIKEVQECLDGSFDTAKQEQRKCLSGSSVTTEKAKGPGVKHPASTNDKRCMRSQTRSKEEPQKCTDEEPDTSLEVIHSKAQLAPDGSDECCTNSQADCRMSNSGQSPQLLTNGHSSLAGFKRLKTSTDHASVQSPALDTVGEALMDVEKLAHKIRRAEALLQSISDAPSSRALAPSWRFCR